MVRPGRLTRRVHPGLRAFGRWLRAAWVVGVMVAVAGCAQAETAPPSVASPAAFAVYPVNASPASGWQLAYVAAQAGGGESPSLVLRESPDGLRAGLAWPAAANLWARAFDFESRVWSPDRPLDLPVQRPYAAQSFPATYEASHLLWLDAWTTPDGEVENRLVSASVPYDGPVERGALAASTLPTVRYSAVPDGAGGLWAAWSGGLPERPDLHITYIDAQGRPAPSRLLTLDADWPLLLTTTTTVEGGATAFDLFWMHPQTRTVYHALMADEALSGIRPLLRLTGLRPGDQLLDFRAGLDQTHLYLFWNIVTLEGEAQTWMASAPFVDDGLGAWSVSAALRAAVLGEAGVQTGFNSGAVVRAGDGGGRVSWAAPLAGSPGGETLPVAAQVGETLAVLYFRAGAIIGYQAIAPAEAPGLLAAPHMVADIERHLYIAWAQPAPSADAPAELRFVTTRR